MGDFPDRARHAAAVPSRPLARLRAGGAKGIAAAVGKSPVWMLGSLLVAQTVGFYAVAARRDIVPVIAPLAQFPRVSNGWTAAQEHPIDKEVQDVLKADDTLHRVYVNQNGADA